MVKSNLKIAYIVPSLDDTTGWGRWACEFLAYVVKRRVEPVLWAPESAKNSASTISFNCQAYFVLPELFDYIQSRSGIKGIIKICVLLKSFLRDNHIQLVHSFDAHPWGLYGYMLANTLKVPHVITTHGRYGYIAHNRKIDRCVYRKVIQGAARIITVSDAVKNEMLKFYSTLIPQNRIQTLLNAVDSKKIEDVERKREKTNAPVIISVTRYIPVKDIETSLRAFSVLKTRYSDAVYNLIGPGNGPNNGYFKMIMDLIKNDDIGGVQILGRVDKGKLEALYKEADILLHTPRTLPDDFEAYGLVVTEAGMYELPVVATRSGGVTEAVIDGETGILVEERDYQAAAEAMIALIEDKARARSYGKKGREIALLRNWESYIDEQMKIYKDVLSDGIDKHYR